MNGIPTILWLGSMSVRIKLDSRDLFLSLKREDESDLRDIDLKNCYK